MTKIINETEEKHLMDHEYDGIQEFNFPLPNWWLTSFWLGIIFGVGYISYFIFMNGPSLKHEYYAEKEKMEAVRLQYLEELMEFDEDKYQKQFNNEEMQMYGQAVFENNCIACHNKNAAGDIGPNLTDKYWIYTEGKHPQFYKFIIEGSPISGMPAWGETLSEDDLYAVTSYIYSLQGMTHTNPPAKESRGDYYE